MTAAIGKMVKGSRTYQTALLIYSQGPILDDQLFIRIDYGVSRYARNRTLQNGVAAGWLTHDDVGVVGITEKARAQVEDEMSTRDGQKYLGKPAESRSINLLHRPAYVPPKRANLREEPEWAKRPAGFRFHTVV